MDAGLSLVTDFKFGQIEPFKASTAGERGAMLGVDIGGLMAGGAGLLSRAGAASRAGAIQDLAGAARIESATATAGRLGTEGEKLSGIVKNTERIPSLTGTANYRIPDALNFAAKTIEETKNVGYLSRTAQIRDNIAFAKREGFRFTLHVRSTTRLSAPLQREVASGNVHIKPFRF